MFGGECLTVLWFNKQQRAVYMYIFKAILSSLNKIGWISVMWDINCGTPKLQGFYLFFYNTKVNMIGVEFKQGCQVIEIT